MPKTVEFLFDFVSPTSWLAWARLPGVLQRTGATAIYTPMFLGGVMQATGNRPPATVPAKGRWMQQDMEMWAEAHGIPFGRNEHFPVNTLFILRGAVGLADDPRFMDYCEACFRGVWVNGRDLAQPEEIAAAVGHVIGAEELTALATDPANKAALKESTDSAVERGVFGAPTFFVGDRMFFGQDRLDFVERALS